MFSPEFLTYITICFYSFATLAGITGLALRKRTLCRLGCWFTLLSFACQTLILIFGFHALLPNGLSFGAYLQLLAWFFLLAGTGAWLRLRNDAILLFAAPLGLILFLMSLRWLENPIVVPPSLSASFYILHIGALFLGLGLLALGFVAGFIFIFIQRRIKARKKMSGVWENMPALAILDKLNKICAIGAFPLYTLGVIAGFFFARPLYGSALSGDPKEIASLVIWALLGLLFYNRLARNWQGRKPALLVCIVFILSVFSILVINIFLPTHHGVFRS